jgi:hypothetical protein
MTQHNYPVAAFLLLDIQRKRVREKVLLKNSATLSKYRLQHTQDNHILKNSDILPSLQATE